MPIQLIAGVPQIKPGDFIRHYKGGVYVFHFFELDEETKEVRAAYEPVFEPIPKHIHPAVENLWPYVKCWSRANMKEFFEKFTLVDPDEATIIARNRQAAYEATRRQVRVNTPLLSRDDIEAGTSPSLKP